MRFAGPLVVAMVVAAVTFATHASAAPEYEGKGIFVAVLDTGEWPNGEPARGVATFRVSDDGQTVDVTIAGSALLLYPTGWRIESTQPDGTIHTYEFDDLGNVVSEEGKANVVRQTLTSQDIGEEPGNVFVRTGDLVLYGRYGGTEIKSEIWFAPDLTRFSN